MKQKKEGHATTLADTSERLRKSEDRYHKMIEEVEDYAIILLDEEGSILNWNKGAEKIKGYGQSEVVGKHFSIFYLPEDRAAGMPEMLLNEAKTNGKATYEGWRVRKDGSKFWGSITLTALHGQDQEVIGYSKVTRDLTERKLAEDQLKAIAEQLRKKNEELALSEERYHRMIGEVQDYSIILLDVNGIIQNWNVGAEKIKGYRVDEIIGKSFQIFYREEDRQRRLPQQLLAEASKSDRSIHEGWRVRKDGSEFWGSTVITALHDERGNIIGYSKVTRDLTEKKLNEDKLKEYVHELQQRNEELDRFAFAASHDLQEPLRKVQTFADLIEQNPGDPAAVTRYVNKILTSADRMVSLVRSVLEYSRLSKTVSMKVETDLQQILSDVLTDFEVQISEKNAIVNIGPLPVIRAIPQQVTQLFSNLIGNALKFSTGAPVINISAKKVSRDDINCVSEFLFALEYHEIKVSDNGIGFEPEYAEQIFSLFQRLHGKHEYSGTGIGLSLCKKIMDNHDGCICAEGRPGEGATFNMYFPILKVPA
ncbi:MAG: PAS domain S-box protein [Chitinophagaceae bacterium]|nr:PAS domain S-box protein [Chitinophagaceae bacterium]